MGNGGKGREVWKVLWVVSVWLVEGKFFEDPWEVTEGACCCARFGLVEGLEENVILDDKRWGQCFGVPVVGLVRCGGIIKFVAEYLFVGGHGGLGHGFGEVAVGCMIAVFIYSLLGKEMVVFRRRFDLGEWVCLGGCPELGDEAILELREALGDKSVWRGVGLGWVVANGE